MPGPASYSESADDAASARERLDALAVRVASFETAQRAAISDLVAMWPSAAWLAAGCTSAKKWLLAYTSVSEFEAHKLSGIAELCARHPALAGAVADGTVSVARAARLARAVTPERASHFDDEVVGAFVGLCADGVPEDEFAWALRYWVERVDEQVEPRRVPPHGLYLSERLFGGGDLQASLAPAAFARVANAIDAWSQGPEPKDAPYVRTLAERRADGLDDMAAFSLSHEPDDDDVPLDLHDPDLQADDCSCGDSAAARSEDAWRDVDVDDRDADEDADEREVDSDDPDDFFDGIAGVDALDVALERPELADDPLELLRMTIRKADARQRRRRRRRVKPRSGVTANVHIDLRTLSGTRDIDDLSDLVLHGAGWGMTKAAAEELLCDSAMVATLFDGKTRILDANEAAEQWNRQQRRAIAGRDRGCVFPGCGRPPRHTDIHHLRPRSAGGPTVTLNGACLCRFHHRLVHHHGWTITIDDDDRWVAVDPHGTEWTGRSIGDQTAA